MERKLSPEVKLSVISILLSIKEGIDLLSNKRDEWLTTAELCHYLNRSRQAIHRYKKENLIPYKKIGGRYYFNKKQIDQSIFKKGKLE